MKPSLALVAACSLFLVSCSVGQVTRNGKNVVANFSGLAGLTKPAELSSDAAMAAAKACGDANVSANLSPPDAPDSPEIQLNTTLSRAKAIYEWWPRNRIIVSFKCQR